MVQAPRESALITSYFCAGWQFKCGEDDEGYSTIVYVAVIDYHQW